MLQAAIAGVRFFLRCFILVAALATGAALDSGPSPSASRNGEGTGNGRNAVVASENGEETQQVLPVIAWKLLRPGLELGLTILPESLKVFPGTEASSGKRSAAFVVLRIDSDLHSFELSMASETGQAFSLADWSRKDGLVAGVNAAMYLPDNRTSTGYMRSGNSVNNSRMVERLVAFFVAGRRKPGIPEADIIERGSASWRERLEDYSIVVQNYRLISSDGRLLWPEGGSAHSIAVVAKDEKGRILFLLSQEPLSVERFAWYLARLHLDLSTVMYVEGGQQAGLFVCMENSTKRVDGGEEEGASQQLPPELLTGASVHAISGGTAYIWKGRQSLLGTQGNPAAALPNVIGVKRDHVPPALREPRVE